MSAHDLASHLASVQDRGELAARVAGDDRLTPIGQAPRRLVFKKAPMHVSRTQLANANQLLRYRAVARPLNRTRL